MVSKRGARHVLYERPTRDDEAEVPQLEGGVKSPGLFGI